VGEFCGGVELCGVASESRDSLKIDNKAPLGRASIPL
jgi:hypothetical protein